MGTWTPGPGATAGNDTYTGTTADETVDGLAGNDTITGAGGEDFLDGGEGDDTFIISATSHLSSGDTYLGGAGDDQMRLTVGGTYNFNGVVIYDVERLVLGANLVANFFQDEPNISPETITVDGQGRTATFNFTSLNSWGVRLEGWTFTNGNFNINLIGNAESETFVGTNLADTINAGNGSDQLHGGAGADTLIGGLGDDYYFTDGLDTIVETAGGGSDWIVVTESFSLATHTYIENLDGNSDFAMTLTGNNLNNQITGGWGGDTLYGGIGDDWLAGGNGYDTLYGGVGNDTYIVQDNADTVVELSGEGIDTIEVQFGFLTSYSISGFEYIENLSGRVSSAGTYALTGNAFDNVISILGASASTDTLNGGGGNDTLSGGGGNDTLIGGSGADALDGGSGIDTASYTFSSGVLADLLNTAGNVGDAAGDTYVSIENLMGSAGNDVLNGDNAANTLTGGDGNDYLEGRGGADVFIGGLGQDSVRYMTASASVDLNLGVTSMSTGDAAGDTYSSIELFVGSSYDDRMIGASGADTLDGYGGDDMLDGRDGADVLYGGAGDDQIYGSANWTGADWLAGEGGNDRFEQLGAGDLAQGGEGDDSYFVWEQGVILYENSDEGVDSVIALVSSWTLADNIENLLFSGISNVTAIGNSMANYILGTDGADTITGGSNADHLVGGAGDDTFRFVSGDVAEGELISGGDGNDQLQPGERNRIVSYGDVDFSLASAVRGIAALTIEGGSATFDATQFSANGVSQSLEVTGTTSIVDMLVIKAGSITADFSGLTFLNWTYQDVILLEVTSYGAADITGTGGNDEMRLYGSGGTLRGGLGNDLLTGSAGNDILYGDVGADFFSGGMGADTLYGGAGNDTFWYNFGYGADVIDGGADNDTLAIYGHASDSILRATLVGGVLTHALDMTLTSIESVTADMQGGVDWLIYTTTEAVTANLGAGSASGFASLLNVENIISGAGADNLAGSDAANKLDSGDGADVLRGGGGNDELVGGDGDDLLFGGTGNDILRGQGGVDYVSYADETDSFFVTFNGQANVRRNSAGAAVEDLLDGIEHFIGGAGNDTVLGNSPANIFYGGLGNDTLNGGGGNDTLYGEDGDDILIGGGAADTISGGAGNDTIQYQFGDGADSIDGGADADTLAINGTNVDNILNVVFNGAGLTHFFGNAITSIENVTANMQAGVDWLLYNTTSSNVSVDLNAGTASGFSFITGIENAIGGTGNDTLTGSNIVNTLDGGDGDDTLSGLNGNDTLRGGLGADTITGGVGADNIDAGAGNDTIIYAFGDGADSINGGADSDTLNITGSASDNLLRATWNGSALTQVLDANLTSVETINADMAGGVDWIIYTASAAVSVDLGAGTATGFASIASVENAVGGTGGDTLTGAAGVNTLDGGDGGDTLSGLAGADVIRGGAGDDVITGGDDNDTLTGGSGADRFVYAAGAGGDTITDFDATGGVDLIDLTGLGITALDFGARVAINDLGDDAQIVIDGAITLTLLGVNGDGSNVLDAGDFLLAP